MTFGVLEKDKLKESNQRVDLTVAPRLQSKRSFAAGKVLGLIDGLHCRATAGHT